MSRDRDYVLGTHDDEISRLALQHRVWRPRALDAWRRAGFTVGQTLLDIGCGPGHASVDLAEIVGPSGRIVAIDRSRRFLDALEATRLQRGLDNITTLELDLDVAGPPAVAAAKGHTLDRRWVGWAVAASLWRHYVGEVDTKLQKDAALAEKGDLPGLIEHVKTRAKRTDSAIPEPEDFLQNIVSDGGVFLALLIHFHETSARSFPGGKLVNAADEPLEVHHIFPRAVLDRYPQRDNEYVPDRLGNLTALTRSDNEHLSDSPPHSYLPQTEKADLAAHLIPEDPVFWQVERFRDFCEQRERLLASTIDALLRHLGLS